VPPQAPAPPRATRAIRCETTRIDGTYAPGFEHVADAFAASEETGASLAVAVDGELVVDVWRGWLRDSIVNIASASKGLTSACLHLALADVDVPVASLWPEFAAAGKSAVTVAQLLDHTAGLPAIREPLPPGTIFDWNAMTAALAAETPWWEPGTRHGYHAVTFGHPGAGGALGFADPDHRLGFGYTPQRMLAAGMGGDPRWQPLIAAVYAK
jgi:CubicO group peptidase (beta-lactamase class C family)